MNGQEDPAPGGQTIVHGHPPEGARAVEIDEGLAPATLEQLDPPPVDGQRALVIRRGRDLGHRTPSRIRQERRRRKANEHKAAGAREKTSRIMRDVSSWAVRLR